MPLQIRIRWRRLSNWCRFSRWPEAVWNLLVAGLILCGLWLWIVAAALVF